ncbi:MAG TPA: PKD domain-containing protein, partial [Polyangiaceae bacterium]|nr:PKD domain-containing protein [Polyangiaceae bacterium]
MTLAARAVLLAVGYGLFGSAALGCSDNKAHEPALTPAGGAGGGSSQLLAAVPGPSRYALVGETVTLDGSASTGAESYQWNFGDGRSWDTPRSESAAEVVYDRPGRYQAVLTVFDAASRKQSAGVTISVTHPLAYEYGYSATLLREPDGDRFAVVSTDADQLVLVERQGETFAVTERVDTCEGPRTVALFQGYYVTACPDVDTVSFHPRAGGVGTSALLPYGSGPFAVADGGDALYVSLRGSGKVARFVLDQTGSPELETTFDGIQDGRALAVLPDGRVAVARMRSPDEQGEVMVIDPTDGSSKLVTLAFDTQVASDAEIGGVPTYLSQIAVSPTGREAVIPSLMANVAEGAFRSGRALAFDTTIRAALSKLDLEQDSERFEDRIQFDELGFAEAVAFSQRGDYAFVVMPGARSVVKVDLLSGTSTGAFLDAGYAPDGASVTVDDRYLLVNSQLSRELAIYDLEADSPMPGARVPLLDHEPLSAQVLLGKQLFNDSADPRISKAGYIACAHCHLDGDSDGR